MPPRPHDHPASPQIADLPQPPGHPPERGNSEAITCACPYCGEIQRSPNRCEHCGAHTDPLSKQATQNEMGPWFVRDPDHPFRPGCRLETIERWVRVGRIGPETVIRGPSTNQHWTQAIRVPGVARLLGRCHACRQAVELTEVICGSCGTSLEVVRDRQHLGLSPVRALPGRTDPGLVASSLLHAHPARTPPKAHPTQTTALPSSPPNGDHVSRQTRLDRRVRRAERRSAVMSIAAVSFALLFAGSLVVSRLGGDEDTTAAPRGALEDAPVEQPLIDDDPGGATPDQSARPTIAATPDADSSTDTDSRRRLLATIEALASSGQPADLAEARRLLESAESGTLTPEDTDRWRRRIELAEQALERSRTP